MDDLPRLLSCLAVQDWTGRFEVVLWNNNRACLSTVEEICDDFRGRLNLTAIHSSENYYCLPRQAVVPLMRSDLLLTCDDDVVPGPGFLGRFVSRFERYGPHAALCARGHVFLPHALDEQHPERAWAQHRGLQFYDEHEDDRRVHVLHASTALVPKRVLRAALGYELERPEFALVDDYWLSFVLGQHLDVPVWKIRADDVLAFTPSSDDPSVALFHDPAVQRERVRFYVHHMRAGWPDFGKERRARRSHATAGSGAGAAGGTDVLVVTGDPPWPPHHGGRVRVTRMVEALRTRLAVRVAAPLEGPPPDGLPVEELAPARPVRRFEAMATPRPRLGRTLLDPHRVAELDEVLVRTRPRAVLFVNGYIAACAPAVDVPTVIDFHDVDARRMVVLARYGSPRARAAHGLEALKARWWEPRVARQAAVVSAATPDEVAMLASWGARAVHVPNGVDRIPLIASPADGPVTLVASLSYAPNRLAAEWLLGEVWPRVREADPGIRLRIVGRRARPVLADHALDDRVEVVSDPPSIDRYYEEASFVLAPARAGGGSQLKVYESLARGRVLVATSFSARSVPPAMRGGVVVADDAPSFAAHIVRLWRDVAVRRAHEQAIAAAPPLPTWQEAWAPLVDALERLVRTG